MIIPDGRLNLGSSSSGPDIPDDVYSEIMAAIGDLSVAGFEGKTLAEVFREIKNSVCETATDEKVDSALDDAFGKDYIPPAGPGGVESPDNTAADHLKRKIVTGVDAIDLTAEDADQYFYMVLKTGSDEDNVYDVYMVLDGKVEHVGNTKVDLTGYVQRRMARACTPMPTKRSWPVSTLLLTPRLPLC